MMTRDQRGKHCYVRISTINDVTEPDPLHTTTWRAAGATHHSHAMLSAQEGVGCLRAVEDTSCCPPICPEMRKKTPVSASLCSGYCGEVLSFFDFLVYFQDNPSIRLSPSTLLPQRIHSTQQGADESSSLGRAARPRQGRGLRASGRYEQRPRDGRRR